MQGDDKLPWFKFNANAWLAGDIQFETLEAQGLFINMCALYWKRGCSLAIAMLERRYPCARDLLPGMLEAGIVRADTDGNLEIAFLDAERTECSETRRKRAEAGRKGGLAKARNGRATAGLQPGFSLATAETQPGSSNKSKSKSKSKSQISEEEHTQGARAPGGEDLFGDDRDLDAIAAPPAWVKALLSYGAKGCRPHHDGHGAWARIIEEHGEAAVMRALQRVPHDDRWAATVEARLATEDCRHEYAEGPI